MEHWLTSSHFRGACSIPDPDTEQLPIGWAVENNYEPIAQAILEHDFSGLEDWKNMDVSDYHLVEEAAWLGWVEIVETMYDKMEALGKAQNLPDRQEQVAVATHTRELVDEVCDIVRKGDLKRFKEVLVKYDDKEAINIAQKYLDQLESN